MSVVKSLEHSAFRCSRKLILKVSSGQNRAESTLIALFSGSMPPTSNLRPRAPVLQSTMMLGERLYQRSRWSTSS